MEKGLKEEEGPHETPQEYCRRITRKRAKNFYWAIITLPREKRQAVYSIYAFARRCDDIADSDLPLDVKQSRLQNQKLNIDKLYDDTTVDKLYTALSTTVTKYDIPKRYFKQLIAGVEMDLQRSEYQTFSDLKIYCYRVASIVGLILIEIFEYSEEIAKKYAIDLGIGMQLTNIIRDVSEDYQRGRIYIPQSDLERFNCNFDNMNSTKPSENFKELMDFEAERARNYFQSGKKLFPLLTRRSRACPAGLYGVYSSLLNHMENSGWDIWNKRASLSLAKKVTSVIGQWFTTLK